MNRNYVSDSLVTLDARVGHPELNRWLRDKVAANRAETVANHRAKPEWKAWVAMTDAERAAGLCPFGSFGRDMETLEGIGGRGHVGQ